MFLIIVLALDITQVMLGWQAGNKLTGFGQQGVVRDFADFLFFDHQSVLFFALFVVVFLVSFTTCTEKHYASDNKNNA